MSKRVAMLLAIWIMMAVMLWLSIAAWVVVKSRDIAPPDTSDLAVDTIQASDANNAYTYFLQAGRALQWPKDVSQVNSMVAGATWDDGVAADLVSRNGETLALLRRGLTCAVYQPRDELESSDRLPIWQRLALSRLMALQAAYERRMGHEENAWRCACDLLRFASLIGANPNTPLDSATGTIAFHLGCTELQWWLGTWSVDEAHLAELLDQLNGMGEVEQGHARAIKKEFRLVAEGIDETRSTMAHHLLGRYAFQPNRTTAISAEFHRALIACFSRPYAQVHLPQPRLRPTEGIHRRLLPLRNNSAGETLLRVVLLAPDRLDRIVTIRCTMQSHLDGFRLVVACRLYEMRHGRLPEDLDTLVPELLRTVPRDPYDGQPFRYSREDAVVYSVGKDLKDSWCLGERTPDTLLPGRVAVRTDDLVYSIHAKPQ